MNIAVLGCGAIGGLVAAHLTRAGQRVTPITGNPEIARAISRHGLRARELDGSTWAVAPSVAPLVTAEEAAGAAPFDLCILATQSTRLLPALTGIRPHLTERAPVLCLQNGLPEDRAAEVIGRRRVVGCVVGWGASMQEPGLYVRTSRGGFTIGWPAAAGDQAGDGPALAPLAELLAPAGAVKIAADLAGVRWSKLAVNCVTTTVGALGGAPLGVLMRHRFVRRLALEIFAEVAAVARAAGVRMAKVGGTLDIQRVAITPAERRFRLGSPSLAFKHSVLLAVGLRFRRLRSSMLYALERGRPPEIDFINLEVVTRGERLGVPTPVNRALVNEVRALFRHEATPGVATLRGVYQRELGAPHPRA